LTFPVSAGLQAKHVKATTIQVLMVLATGEIPLLLINVMPEPPAFAIQINEQKINSGSIGFVEQKLKV
ncbi:MAG: hypothetical protein EBU49_14600, partial [Proteobacteria bacterium]|nr:hypothetical protein [Pseudomonadota bacterium]